MSSKALSGNNATCKVYHDQQQYPTTAMLDHRPIRLASRNHHDFALLPSSPFYSTAAATLNKIDHSGMKKSHDLNMTEEAKRQQVLEKNRLAASKCRQRKKAWVEELTKKSDQAMYQNASLKRGIAQLKEEILFLKSQLLAHRSCQCQVINNYIKLHMIESLHHFESAQSTSFHQRPVASPRKNSFC